MKNIIQKIAKKIHYALFLIVTRFRSFWAWAVMGQSGKNLKVLGQVTLFYPSNIFCGDNCTINQGVLIDARDKVTIGNDVRISSYSLIETAYLEKSGDPREHLSKPIVIKDNVWIASGAKILAGVTIGENSIIAASAVVTRDVPPNSLARGIPATLTPLYPDK